MPTFRARRPLNLVAVYVAVLPLKHVAQGPKGGSCLCVRGHRTIWPWADLINTTQIANYLRSEKGYSPLSGAFTTVSITTSRSHSLDSTHTASKAHSACHQAQRSTAA